MISVGRYLGVARGFVGNESVHMILYHNAEDDRMCDHDDGRFKAEFPFCMSRILVSHGVYDPYTVTNMIHY